MIGKSTFLFALLIATRAFAATGFPVTNTNDDGPGSLRQAIVDANASADCDTQSCVIGFAIAEPLPPSGWFTIRPLTPLPAITARNVSVEGPPGRPPAVEMSGEHLTGYTAVIELRDNCTAAVRSLAIDGSSGPGVLLSGVRTVGRCTALTNVQPDLRPDFVELTNDYIGVDPALNRAPNERGIVDGSGTLTASIVNNVISGNRRSGIFLTGAQTSARIVGNFIGADPNFNPIGNGASGVVTSKQATIESNVIAYNRDFGIAAGGPVELISTPIFGNGLTAISFGMRLENAGPQVVIDSAAAHEVRGHVPALSIFQPSSVVTIDSSFGLGLAGYGEAEIVEGVATVENDGSFVLHTIDDLTGRYLTASETRSYFDPDQGSFGTTTRRSSELSAPYHVLP